MKVSRDAAIRIVFVVAVMFAGVGQAAGKDVWTRVTSKNFTLIGNASDKDIRRVATRLEQFRETFRLLFNRTSLTASVPTNVIVFRNESSYRDFKPRRPDGKPDERIAGYFQSSEDVNYITLSAEGPDSDTFGTIFHEYVHFIINTNFGKSDVPAWFNEGLAEYYQTFQIEEDQRIKLGIFQQNHLYLLQQNQLMPLDTLFSTTNFQLHQTGGHSRSIFYAQSWALIHYLIQKGKTEAMGKFLNLLVKGDDPKQAFAAAFQSDYKTMESELRAYVRQDKFNYHQYTLAKKLVFDAQMTSAPLSDADTNAYLGDLLYHTRRAADAERYLAEALRLEPAHPLASTALGMVRLGQRRFDEARTLLERAVAAGTGGYSAYYRYGYLLIRSAQDEFGFIKSYTKEEADKIRAALNKAIELNPAFTESYELLAFVSLIRGEQLDEAVALLQKARAIQPGNQRYALRLGEVYARMNKLDEAAAIAMRVALTADEQDVRTRAESLRQRIETIRQIESRNAAERKRYDDAIAAAGKNGPPTLVRRVDQSEPPSEAEMKRQQDEATLRTVNQALRRPAENETRVIGRVSRIDCRVRPLAFTVKTPAETFIVSSKDFDSLELNAYEVTAKGMQIGCESDVSAINAVVTYRRNAAAKAPSRGDLVAVEFVPANFRFLTPDELKDARLVIYEQPDTASGTSGGPPPPAVSNGDDDAKRRDAMFRGIREGLRQPADGQKREIGFLDAIECTNKGMFFALRTDAGRLRLTAADPQQIQISGYTPDLAAVQFGCGVGAIDFPVVFIFTVKADTKARTDGELRSLEFVPKGFTLDN